MPTLRLNDEQDIPAREGETILGALAAHQVFLPSACGGRGLCGLCRCRVKEEAGPFSEAELKKLSEEDRRNGSRLGCQVKVDRDLSLGVPPQLLGTQEWEVTLERVRDLTHDIKGFRFALPRGARLPFQAGQYIQLTVPPYGNVTRPSTRAYSVSSPPSDNRAVELMIRRVPRGIATTFLFEQVQPGYTLRLSGPYGDFRLRDSDREIVMIAGATGLAPMRSLLLDMAERKIAQRRTTLFFGALTRRDLFALDELETFAREHPWFRFVPALSQETEAHLWPTGLVTEVLRQHYGPLDRHEAYLCGSPGMIDACVATLQAKGMPADLIFYDKFL